MLYSCNQQCRTWFQYIVLIILYHTLGSIMKCTTIISAFHINTKSVNWLSNPIRQRWQKLHHPPTSVQPMSIIHPLQLYGTPPDSSASTKSTSTAIPFTSFQFSPNGVCISPKYFVLLSENENIDNNNENNDNHHKMVFTMRNVPGDGDCMFLAVALATLASIGLGGNDVLLRAISRETRETVASILQYAPRDSKLIISKNRTVSVNTLLTHASAIEKLNPIEYLNQLRLEGRDGGLYGGGPELTVLSNVLRRPISIYHLLPHDQIPSSDTTTTTATTTTNDIDEVQYIQCMGIFGADAFPDPLVALTTDCSSAESSASSSSALAVLTSNIQPYGAYSWHLHILVVDSSPNEKHACVLLPQQLEKQTQQLLQQFQNIPSSLTTKPKRTNQSSS